MPERRKAQPTRADIFDSLQALHEKVDHLHHVIHRTDQRSKRLMVKATEIDADLDRLQADAESTTDLVTAVAGVVDGLVNQVSTLQQQLNDAIANGADPATLQSISDKMARLGSTIDSQQLAIAAIKGTPAAPVALQGVDTSGSQA